MYDFIHNAAVIWIATIAFAIIAPFIAYYFFLNRFLIYFFSSSFPASIIRPFTKIASWIFVVYYAIDIINLLFKFNTYLEASPVDFTGNAVTDLSALVALYFGIKNNQRINA